MDWLNYHHLYYFWTVAREGSINAACKRLLLAPPTLSAQIRQLEERLGVKLFDRVGRGLVLTDAGRLAYRYADEIFGLGQEFLAALKGGPTNTPLRLSVGVNDVLPKMIVARLLQPVFTLSQPVRVDCVQGTPEQLIPPLSVHDLDIVLNDAPVGPQIPIRAYSHLLGECGVSLFASPAMATRLRRNFPASLNNAPAFLPAAGSALRIALDKWFESVEVRPRVLGQFEDIELLAVTGRQGLGFFPGHSVMAREIVREHRVRVIGEIEGYRAQFYAISLERRIAHPAIRIITEHAREGIFA